MRFWQRSLGTQDAEIKFSRHLLPSYTFNIRNFDVAKIDCTLSVIGTRSRSILYRLFANKNVAES